jgi:hypothetical protein
MTPRSLTWQEPAVAEHDQAVDGRQPATRSDRQALVALRAAALEAAVHLKGTAPVHDRRQRRCLRWCRACALDRLLGELGVDDPFQALLDCQPTSSGVVVS